MFFKKRKSDDGLKIEETGFEKEVLDNQTIHIEKINTEQKVTLERATGESEEELKRQFELFKVQKVLKRIDHTLLKHNIEREDLKKLCRDAQHYGFCSVCVHPVNVEFVKRQLGENNKVRVCAVVGFPFGENLSSVKAYETKKAIASGADEIDMVISVSALKRGDFKYVKKDIQSVVRAARKKTVKVIIETSLLTVKEMEQACHAIIAAKAQYVKTSTGYFGEGASVNIVAQLKSFCKDKIAIKASGGIKSSEDAVALLNAGANRLGTSNGVAIAEGLKTQSDY